MVRFQGAIVKPRLGRAQADYKPGSVWLIGKGEITVVKPGTRLSAFNHAAGLHTPRQAWKIAKYHRWEVLRVKP